MKKNRLIAVVLALATFLTSGMTVLADRVDAKLDKPFISLGADLNAEEKSAGAEYTGGSKKRI